MELQGNFGFGARSAAATEVTGAGTTPKIPKWTGANTLGDSQVEDDGAGNLTLIGEVVHTLSVKRATTAEQAGFNLENKAGDAALAGTDLNGGDHIIKTGKSTGKGYADIVEYSPSPGTTGTDDNEPIIRRKIYTRLMEDNDVLLLETGRGGQGWVQLSDNTEYAWFTFTRFGVVTLLTNSANVTTVAATNNALNIYDNGSGVAIETTFADPRRLTIKILYN